MATKSPQTRFSVEVPLDASSIEGFQPDQDVKVVVQYRKGSFKSKVVKLDRQGMGVATLAFARHPGSMQVMVGPANVADEEMPGLQTINVKIPARRLRRRTLKLAPILIKPYYWYWWRRWCRDFTIRGVVKCADGSPVPGAKVCAFDVDWWWWWISNQQVGCDTTDATGAFEIKFRWCCGWWPWWWWRRRFWQLEPVLVEHIQPILKRDIRLPQLPTPSPRPNLAIFNRLLADDRQAPTPDSVEIDPAQLPALRERLIKRLPEAAELRRLRIWPWWPWYPWWDCRPDIIFRATQTCEGQEKVIVEETFGDARWNIPTTLDDVVLVANEEACCLGIPDEDPEGKCLRIDEACRDLVNSIGGNPGAAVAPVGYLNPGAVAKTGDRPYGGTVNIFGAFGDAADVDYYEFEWTETPAVPASWAAMPPGAAGGFRRWYWGVQLGTADPPNWHSVLFQFGDVDGHHVVVSREHFEETHDHVSWQGGARTWSSSTQNFLMRWRPQNFLPDGTYYLRVKGWKIDGAGHLSLVDDDGILPLCLVEDDNGIVLTIDNRVVTLGPTDPNGHPCGAGFVHKCTDEPDTRIISVKILHDDGTEVEVDACGEEAINDTDRVQIDFLASDDPGGHLAYYTLHAEYGADQVVPLIDTDYPGGDLLDTVAGASLTANLGAFAGPNYGHPNAARSALDQGAASPEWKGGVMRFVAPADRVFPETCCYQLELRAHKRTVVNCHHTLWGHWNESHHSFMIVV